MKTVKIILFNLVVVLVLLAIIDPFLAPKDTDSKAYRSLSLREFGPDRDLWLSPVGHDVDTTKLDSETYHLQTDHQGFIMGPEDEVNSLPEIIFYGGSTTECVFVDDSLRFPYRVGRLLTKTQNRTVITRNSGYGGNHSFHSLINLLGNGLIVNPKTVVWMHNINDLTLLGRTGSYFISPANRAVLQVNKQENPTWIHRLKRVVGAVRDFLFPNIYQRTKQVLKVDKANGQVDEWEGFRNLPEVPKEQIEANFTASVQSFVDVAKAHGIEVVLMTQFNQYTPENKEQRHLYELKNAGKDYADFIAQYASMNQIIRKVAADNNVKIIDLDRQMPKEPGYFYDGVHVNNAGSKFVANLIASELSLDKNQISQP